VGFIISILDGFRTLNNHRSPSIHLIGAYQVLYTFVIRRPLYISASSDVQLLGSACGYFESGMENLSQGPEILAVMQKMQAKASTEVQKAAGNVPSIAEAVCSSEAMKTISNLSTEAGNYGHEDLMFGYNLADMQLFYDVNDMDLGWGSSVTPASL
jgi:hypothetical protein